MEEGSRIGHLNVFRGLHTVRMESFAVISHLNWFTAFPRERRDFFAGIVRSPSLTLGAHAAITSRHLVDCTDAVRVGEFSLVAGYRSQILTHSVNIHLGKQDCAPVEIGRYCFIGTGVIVLGGSIIPDFSVIGAGSTFRGEFKESFWLFSGVPAKPVARLPDEATFFSRTTGTIR
jgi:acetyltransferase-like isoleucine patch superfamily enzyme